MGFTGSGPADKSYIDFVVGESSDLVSNQNTVNYIRLIREARKCHRVRVPCDGFVCASGRFLRL